MLQEGDSQNSKTLSPGRREEARLGQLDWVGMENISCPVLMAVEGAEQPSLWPAEVNFGVSLDQTAERGIHMSRLFLAAQAHLTREVLSFESLEKILHLGVQSQQGLSSRGSIQVKTKLLRRQPALISGEWGWREYPVVFTARFDGQMHRRLQFEVLYSSTCPCSYELAQDVIRDGFAAMWPEGESRSREEMLNWLSKGVSATPHAQRSRAAVDLELARVRVNPIDLIASAEEALQTAVQAAVKRVDEQEFARRNAANLLFCEDAARRLQTCFNGRVEVRKFEVTVEHQESLHAHNAVAKAQG